MRWARHGAGIFGKLAGVQGVYKVTVSEEIPHELDIAKSIRDGVVSSGTKVMGVWLFDLRITGTGAAYRTTGGEYVWRDPAFYLNDDFVARCNGLPVIFEHHEKTVMDGDIYHERNVGSFVLPYIKGLDVWGIARVYDEPTAELLINGKMSTSPHIVFRNAELVDKVSLDDGSTLLIEGKPSYLDSLAICEAGVWDKGGAPSGVNSGQLEGTKPVADEVDKITTTEPHDEAPAWVKGIMDAVSGMGARMDAWEGAKAKADADEKETKEKADKAKKDAEMTEAEKEEKAEEEKREKAMADAADMKARLDAIDAKMPKERSDSEVKELADAQARADSVLMAFGKQARGPWNGETGIAYRRAFANELKVHSPAWKDIDLSKLPDAALANAEADIYKCAADSAMSPATVPEGTLREIKRPDGTGRLRSEFAGDSDVWMNRFKLPVNRRIVGFPLAKQLGQKGLN